MIKLKKNIISLFGMLKIIKILCNFAPSFQEKVPCKQWYNKVKLNNRVVNMTYYKHLCGKEIGPTRGDAHQKKTLCRRSATMLGLQRHKIARRLIKNSFKKLFHNLRKVMQHKCSAFSFYVTHFNKYFFHLLPANRI